MPEPKFLVVRLGSMGDIVHAFPAVAALRQSFPNSDIVWLTHPRWRELVASANLATAIWEVETQSLKSIRELLRKLREERFSIAIDYQGLWKSSALPFLARVPRRIGFSSATVREFGVPLLYTDRVLTHSAHVSDRNGELSLRAGAAKPVANYTLAVTDEAKANVGRVLKSRGILNYCVISPGGGWLSKCWPAERYGQLAARLCSEHGIRTVINYASGEEQLAEKVRAEAGVANPVSYSGSFGELMALLEGAKCVIAGDTGPMHLADALETPVLAIFGPTDPDRNGPYSGRGIVLRTPGVQSTYKRAAAPHPSLVNLSLETVLETLRKTRVME
jgi:lipopolysaccharide heptosyltransferase I